MGLDPQRGFVSRSLDWLDLGFEPIACAPGPVTTRGGRVRVAKAGASMAHTID